MKRIQTVLLFALAALCGYGTLLRAVSDHDAAPSRDLAPRHRQWLEEVDLLLLDEERRAFVALRQDYDRDVFVQRFWQVRDPYPETGRNEYREGWLVRVEEAREQFGDLAGDAARTWLALGQPASVSTLLCLQHMWPIELWRYEQPSGSGFHVVFIDRRRAGGAGLERWTPGSGLTPLMRSPESRSLSAGSVGSFVGRECVRGDEILEALRSAVDLSVVLLSGDVVPRPDTEWVAAFRERLTELPSDARLFTGSMSVDFPGRLGQRTVVQAIIVVPVDQPAFTGPGAEGTLRFVVDGHILRGGRSFDRFRYRFEFPQSELESGSLPLVVERPLRPGTYRMALRIRGLGSDAYFHRELDLEVPYLEQADIRAAPAMPEAKDGAARVEEGDGGRRASDALLAEANRSLSDAGALVRVEPLPERLLTGTVRVEAKVTGEALGGVRFALDGRPVMTKKRPPFAVELDLGAEPRMHRLEAIALDEDGRRLAHDDVLLNDGPYRFRVRLLEPQRGLTVSRSARLRAEVDVPAGESLDRVEFFADETLVATLYQPPFVHPIVLSSLATVTWVRAVAYLTDGHSTEDLVFVNLPEHLERVQVDMVELFTTVTDRRGRPVPGLGLEDFRVFEDGREQRIRRFEVVRDLPIHATVVIDTSTSMRERLPAAERAAYHFFLDVITPRDRASVIVFNDEPRLRVPFTNDPEILAGGLKNLFAEGETAFHDALVTAIYDFSGVRGKRALIVISDGSDTRSRYGFEEALAYAEASGVAVYPIGIDLRSSDLRARMHLEELARRTGGRFFFVDGADELEEIFADIEDELRAQYLLAYQSNAEQRSDFREVEVEVQGRGLEARTIPGYAP